MGFIGSIPVDVHTVIQDAGGSIVTQSTILKMVTVQLNAGVTMQTFLDNIRNETGVRYAHPDLVTQPLFDPNDPKWNEQWAPTEVKLPGAWDYYRSSPIKLAVIDTGVYYQHEDLMRNIDPVRSNVLVDPCGHGTAVIGIAAAILDNGVGIAGSANVSVMSDSVQYGTSIGPPYGVLDKGICLGSYALLAMGIVRAAELGAKVITSSQGIKSTCDTGANGNICALIEDALDHARNYHEAVFIAPAGNCEPTLPGDCEFVWLPGRLPEVVTVSGTAQGDLNWPCSSIGPEVDLSAPAGQWDCVDNIITTMSPTSLYDSNNCPDEPGTTTSLYCVLDGTSFAAPMVAGIAALSLAKCPNDVGDWLVVRLQQVVDDLGQPGWDQRFGDGRVNATKAVTLDCLAP